METPRYTPPEIYQRNNDLSSTLSLYRKDGLAILDTIKTTEFQEAFSSLNIDDLNNAPGGNENKGGLQGIKLLQEFLNQHDGNLLPDGIYGPKSRAAFTGFFRKLKLAEIRQKEKFEQSQTQRRIDTLENVVLTSNKNTLSSAEATDYWHYYLDGAYLLSSCYNFDFVEINRIFHDIYRTSEKMMESYNLRLEVSEVVQSAFKLLESKFPDDSVLQAIESLRELPSHDWDKITQLGQLDENQIKTFEQRISWCLEELSVLHEQDSFAR